jgi:hypothetical protein
LEDLSKPAPPGDGDDPKPLNVNFNELVFAYPLRPNNPVIKELDVKVGQSVIQITAYFHGITNHII